MTIATILDLLTQWTNTAICPQIRLKVPPEDVTDANDHTYEYQLVNPVAFPMFVPTKDKLAPPIRSPFPSICVRLLEGADNLAKDSGAVNVQFCFSAWNPGRHGSDILLPEGESFRRFTGPEANAEFERNADGWRDAWNLVDIARREIESLTNIEGLVIDRSVPIKFGPLTEQEAIPDFYPFWFAWLSFTLTYPVVRNLRDCENLL